MSRNKCGCECVHADSQIISKCFSELALIQAFPFFNKKCRGTLAIYPYWQRHSLQSNILVFKGKTLFSWEETQNQDSNKIQNGLIKHKDTHTRTPSNSNNFNVSGPSTVPLWCSKNILEFPKCNDLLWIRSFIQIYRPALKFRSQRCWKCLLGTS